MKVRYSRSRFTPKPSVLDQLDIMRAYELATGDAPPTRGFERGRVRVRCPFVDHFDADPSCDLSTEKRVFYCHGCSRGGALVDLAIAAGHARSRAEAAAWFEVHL